MGLFDKQSLLQQDMGLNMLGASRRIGGGMGPDITIGHDQWGIQKGNVEMNTGIHGGTETTFFGQPKKK